jgi:hypothetical protein
MISRHHAMAIGYKMGPVELVLLRGKGALALDTVLKLCR